MPSDVIRRFHERPFIPIGFLLFVLLVLGWTHSDFLTPFARPLIAADDEGALVFYDAASMNQTTQPAFIYRSSRDGSTRTRERRIEGRLLDAALAGERFYLLFPGYLSSYERGSLRRLTTLDTASLPFEPRHLARFGNRVMLFGIDEQKALRCAALRDGRLDLLEARLAEAAVPSSQTPAEPASTEAPRSGLARIDELAKEPELAVLDWSSATIASSTYVCFTLGKPASGATAAPALGATAPKPVAQPRSTAALRKTVRWTRFSNQGFAALRERSSPVVAAALSSQDGRPVLFTVADSRSSEVELATLGLEESFEASENIAFTRGGIFENQGVSSLNAASLKGRQVLLAQIGGTIRMTFAGAEADAEWKTVAQLPAEARTLVYGWFAAVMLLVLLLVLSGLRNLRRRRRGPVIDRARFEAAIAELVKHDDAQTASSVDDGEDSEPPGSGAEAPHKEPSAGISARRQVEDGPGLTRNRLSAPATLAPRLIPDGYRDASIVERALAFVIDLGVIFVLISLLSYFMPLPFLAGLMDGEASDRGALVTALQSVYWDLLSGQSLLSPELVVVAAIQGLFGLGYFTLLEGVLGWTCGKRILNLEVRKLGGQPLDLLDSFYRNALRIEMLSGPAGPILFFVSLPTMILTRRTQRPGDLAAATVVLRRQA